MKRRFFKAEERLRTDRTGGETGTGQTYPVLYDTITAYYKMPTHTANYNGGNYVTDSITSGNISAKKTIRYIPEFQPVRHCGFRQRGGQAADSERFLR